MPPCSCPCALFIAPPVIVSVPSASAIPPPFSSPCLLSIWISPALCRRPRALLTPAPLKRKPPLPPKVPPLLFSVPALTIARPLPIKPD
ncbi:hypothetical protein QNH14_22365 [Apirhabdus apintestini]|nr:hypothetical protein QNH14_22365 [Enterobacteriaceae bacterium CA-0114]